jgi:metallo-beta-lactamase family protein
MRAGIATLSGGHPQASLQHKGNGMKIRFLGAAGTVTGSRYLLSHEDTRILIDCGLFQGVKAIRSRNWKPFPCNPGDIQAVVLTHAHLDHCGYLPRLMREGFHGPVWSTHATRQLADILLADSGKLQEEDARHANRYGYSKHQPAEPLYTAEDAARVMKQFRSEDFGKAFSIGPFRIRFAPAGHILGAASLHVECAGRIITFSGDVGRPHDPVMKPPSALAVTDYLVLESTYGDRRHPEEDSREILAGIVRDTVSKGGTVLVPAFAVGRAQLIMFLLTDLMAQNRIPRVPVYLDSPMAIDVTQVFRRHHEEHRLSSAQCESMCSHVTYVSNVEESQAVAANGHPKVIIAGAGMLNGGRILHHLIAFGSDWRNTLVITGFQAEGTRGHALLNGARHLRIYGQEVGINCRVAQIQGLSAHADYAELLEWVKPLVSAPRTTFITHGEPLASDSLRQHIEHELGWTVAVPEQGEEVDLP